MRKLFVLLVHLNGIVKLEEESGLTFKGKIRGKLKELNVEIVERAATTLAGGSVDYSLARYGLMLPSWAVLETLVMIGGYGFKTAVEVVLMVTDYGAVPR